MSGFSGGNGAMGDLIRNVQSQQQGQRAQMGPDGAQVCCRGVQAPTAAAVQREPDHAPRHACAHYR